MKMAKIMLVDDDPNVLSALERLLFEAPFAVETRTSPFDALRDLESGAFDVVVADDEMPGLKGADLLGRVRDVAPETVRIMLTGEASIDSAVRAINVGAVFRFLRKPCSIEDLRGSIDEALAKRGEQKWRREAEVEAFDRALAGMWMAAHPIVDVGRQRAFSYEMLVRSTAAGFPHAGAILDAAEHLDKMEVLEKEIMKKVAEVAQKVPHDTTLFVNLHASSLGTPEILEPLHFIADRVVLEITERASLDHVDAVGERVKALRARGFRIAIDDLGAGYASLTSVAALRPDIVKLDMGLVRRVHDSRTHTSFIRAVLSACDELGIGVIAEGVETKETSEKLRALGCTLQQGFLFARPGPPLPEVGW